MEMLGSHGMHLSTTDVKQLEEEAKTKAVTDENTNHLNTIKRIIHSLLLPKKKTMAIFTEDNPNIKHSSIVKRLMTTIIASYKELTEEK